ncbi:hypothetical protein ACH3XW_31955 [Acanthocheilonema viteae]
MKRLLILTFSLVLTIGVKANIESNVWRLVDAVYPKTEHLRKCGAEIEINLTFKRLIIHNNIILCGESKFFQYKRLLRNNLDLAVNICHRLNIQNGVVEHFGVNYSKVYCIWPKIFSEMNYCVAGFRSNASSEEVDSFHNCSEAGILAKLEQEPPKRSLGVIFTRVEKEDQTMPDSRHSVNELTEQLDLSSSLDNHANVKTNTLNGRKAMVLQLNHHEQKEEDDCHED